MNSKQVDQGDFQAQHRLCCWASMYHVVSLCSGVFVVEYLATQTGGATVNNIFEVRFTDTKID